MNIYVASSWRNDVQPGVVRALREAGHEVYDFRHPAEGDNGFGWRKLGLGDKDGWTAEQFAREVLEHPVAKRGFDLDMGALERADACVLVLPCGRSAHLELGYAVGQLKLSIVYIPPGRFDEPELMYRMCNHVVTSLDEVLALLRGEPSVAEAPGRRNAVVG